MMNSSTSSSKQNNSPDSSFYGDPKSPIPWHRRSRDIIGTVATLSLLELALHVGVSEFNLFEQAEGLTQRSTFVENAVVRAESATAIDVAVVGSSIADGVDLEKLAQEIGDNAAVESYRLVGADSKATAQMLDTVVFPNLEVNWVVYIVSPHDTNKFSAVGKRNETIQSLNAYEKNRFTYRLSRWVEKNLYLYRYRSSVKQALPNVATAKRLLNPSNNSANDKTAEETYEFASYTEYGEAERFNPDLEYIYQLCQQNNTQLVILTLPTNPAVTSDLFQSEATSWVDSVKTFAAERNISFINGFDFIQTESQFRDTHHLSPEGIAPATAAIAAVVVPDNLSHSESIDEAPHTN